MKHTCVCGAEIVGTKESHPIVSELSNPGAIQHNADSIKCSECEKLHISEDDAIAAFESFDRAVKKKNIR